MNPKNTIALSSLLLAVGLATPVAAQEKTQIEGRVSTTLKDKVLIHSGSRTFVVSPDADLDYLKAFDRSRRSVKVKGFVGKVTVDKDLGPVRPLTSIEILERVKMVEKTGMLTNSLDGSIVLRPKGEKPLTLTRVPMALLAPLRGKTVTIGGLLFPGELVLTHIKDEIVKGGYLTNRKEDKTTGKMKYRKVADVTPGQKAIVVGLEGWNTKEKTSAHVNDMDADDMLFVMVKVGDKTGWIPAYKLKLGKVVDDVLRPFRKPTKRSTEQQKQAKIANAPEAKIARQQTQQIKKDEQKKGALGGLDDALDGEQKVLKDILKD